MPVQESFLIFEDLETTGLQPGRDEAVEIASLLTDWKMTEVARFHKKVQFNPALMSPEAAAVNHYDPQVWSREAVPFYEYQHWLAKHIPFGHVAIPVGHNARFDRDILDQRYFKPAGTFFKWAFRCVDTVQLGTLLRVAGVIEVENLKLGTLAGALKVDTGKAHTAWDDMMAVKGIFENLLARVRASQASFLKNDGAAIA